MNTFHTIVVPTDFSPYSEEAYRVALRLASATGARLVMLHIVHGTAVSTDTGGVISVPAKGEPENLTERLRAVYPGDGKVVVEHHLIISDRDSTKHILDFSEKLNCDFIVLGTHGRTGLKHLLFGSGAEEVVRRARCPVVVVKAPIT